MAKDQFTSYIPTSRYDSSSSSSSSSSVVSWTQVVDLCVQSSVRNTDRIV